MSGGAGPTAGLEREVKLALDGERELPSLEDAVPGVVTSPSDPQVLDATYWDTGDLRLIRCGVSLRHRTKDGGSPTWTVKVPASTGEAAGGALLRTEIDVPGPAGRPPPEVARLVAAHARDAELVPVTRLRTTRVEVGLADGSGPLGAFDDDLVEVIEGDDVVIRFRELELEVGGHVPDAVLDDLVGVLRAAGAGAPDPTPKVARALGPRALAPPDLRIVEVGPDATAGESVAAALAAATAGLVAAHPVLCATGNADAARVLRVSARRATTLLRLVGPLVDREWARGVRRELRWLTGALAPLRRTDAVVLRIGAAARSLDAPDRAFADRLAGRVAVPREEQLEVALDVLGSDRYRALVEQLVLAGTALPATSHAERRASVELPRLVRRESLRVARAATAAAAAGADDDALRSLRASARRARVGAELCAPVVGSGAARAASALGDLTDVLGRRRDALAAVAALDDLADGLSGREALVAGRLVAHEVAVARRAERRWPDAWARASHRKATRWL